MSAPYRHRPPRAGRPKKIGGVNLVSITLLLVLAALIYAGWKFIPPWYGQFEVREAMGEVAYTTGRKPDEERLDAAVLERLAPLGVTLLDGPSWTFGAAEVTVALRYRVTVVHPFVLKPTVLTFEPEVTVPRGLGSP